VSSSIIALDVGEKRIGVAIADMQIPFPAPLTTLEASEHLTTEFKALLVKNNVVAVVVGYPRNQQGEPTEQTARVEHITKLLKIPKDTPVYWQDESLTSVKAEEELKRRKKPFAKAAVDSLAATFILEDFIRTQGSLELPKPENQDSQATSKPTKLKKNSKHKKSNKFLKALVVLVLALALVVASAVIWYLQATSARTSEDRYTVVTVKSGTSTAEIARQLEEKQVIRSAQAFSLFVKINRVNNLQAGDYRLSSKQSVKTIVTTISGGKVTTVNVLVSPGQRLDQILTALQKEGYSQQELEDALIAVRDHPLVKDLPQDTPLEGYLFPDTYQIGPTTTAEELFRIMLDHFQEQITPQLKAQLESQGLTLPEAVIMASIVQKEVKDPSVQPTVAQVFLKRYREGIQLGSDVTYMYIEAKTGKQVGPTLDSPYNTRRYSGLPPSAISNFNFSAFNAVANPSKTDYLFFVAGDDGKTYFSKTLEEHEALVKQHCTTLCN
jgi:UPF0755 protein